MNITGKTTLTKFIVGYIKLCGYENRTIACAPNHNARKVLGSFSGLPTVTIHKILKIRPDNYEDEMKFSRITDDSPDPLATCRILLIDEISFIDRDLFNILMKEVPKNCLIIGLGNKDQLKPIPKKVKGEAVFNELSPFFTDDRFFVFELTEIKRSGSPVTTIGERIRNEEMLLPDKSYIDKDGNGVHLMRNMRDFIDKYFEYVKTPTDLYQNRIVAFSNDHVDQLNLSIRNKLYDTEEMFIKDEILVAQAPRIEKDMSGQESILFDNGTFLKVVSAKSYTDYVRVPEVAYELEVEVYDLVVKEMDVFFNEEMDEFGDVPEYTITVLHPNDVPKYNKFLEDFLARLVYIRSNIKNVKPDWKSYYYYKSNKYLDVKYLPACTVHKSQGITVDNVFYFVDFVANLADRDFARRLTYVALTRSRYNSYVLI